MADIKVQRGEATIASSGTSVTISAGGTHYDTPASATSAFIRIVGVAHTADGIPTNFAGGLDVQGVWIDNPGNLLTSITFKRQDSHSSAVTIQWEIWEYTGSAGGANEFKVHLHEKISPAGTTTTSVNSSTATVTNDADVVPWLTSSGLEDSFTGRTRGHNIMWTGDWDGVNNYMTFTRGLANDMGTFTAAVVEFTGSNWTVTKVTHSFSSADTDENETISITDINETMLHIQARAGSDNAENFGYQAWLASTTQLRFRTNVSTTLDSTVYMIENPDLVVENVSEQSWASSGTDPDTDTTTVTSVTMADAAITGLCSLNPDSAPGDSHELMMGLRLTSSTVATAKRGISNKGRNYRFQVVTFPTAGGGGITETVGLATETDSALASSSSKAHDVGQAAESDSALGGTVSKSSPVGQATESNLPLAVQSAKAFTIGQPSESDVALGLSVAKAFSTGLATATETALALTTAKRVTVSIVSEADAALAIAGVLKKHTLGLSGETDSALPVGAGSSVVVGQAQEADTALGASSSKIHGVGAALESDAALTLVWRKLVTLSLAAEVDAAPALSVAKRYGTGLAIETDTGLVLTVSKAFDIGIATESDSAPALVYVVPGTRVVSLGGAILAARINGQIVLLSVEV